MQFKTAHRAAIASIAGLFVMLPSVAAYGQATLVGSGTPLAKPAKVNSFIRSSDAKYFWDGATAYAGNDLTAAIKAFPGQSVDTLMDQCFSGGFATGIGTSGPANYTVTTETNWNEYSLAVPGTGACFTTSWVQSFPRPEGLYTHYTDATNGAAAIVGPPAFPAVTPDPYGPAGASRNLAKKWFENPVFASPDPLKAGNPDPNGNNNKRDVFSNNEYAVLMVPRNETNGAHTPAFQTLIDQLYNSLTSIGFPKNQIIVLYGNKAANTKTTGGTPINGPANEANILNALKTGAGLYGNITGQTAPAAPVATNALFTYFGGHGGSWDSRGAMGTSTAPVNPVGVVVPRVDVLVTDLPANAFLDASRGPTDIGVVILELASASANLAGINLSLDGSLIGSLQLDPSPDLDLTGIIGPANYYDISVPLSLLNTLTSSPLDIGLDGMGMSDDYAGLISAVTFDDYGDTWSVGVAVPEPASFFLLSIACLMLIRRTRQIKT